MILLKSVLVSCLLVNLHIFVIVLLFCIQLLDYQLGFGILCKVRHHRARDGARGGLEGAIAHHWNILAPNQR